MPFLLVVPAVPVVISLRVVVSTMTVVISFRVMISPIAAAMTRLMPVVVPLVVMALVVMVVMVAMMVVIEDRTERDKRNRWRNQVMLMVRAGGHANQSQRKQAANRHDSQLV